MARARYAQWTTSWLAVVSLLLSQPALSAQIEARAAWPNGPLATSGRWIADATGAKITYVGANWPGSLETMIPEGLQYQSIETIVSKIKSLGMNAIRLTYATEMIDQYYDNGEQDVTMQDAFVAALGQQDGTAVYSKVVANNPSFGAKTTRLQVYDAIAAECAKQEIYVHLDNHISKAGWCCSPLDGNSWWGDKYFDVGNWTRGLSFMASHGKTWSNLMSMSLRNELRGPLDDAQLLNSYNWDTWYKYVRQGADAIHSANPDVLIFLSGLDNDANFAPVVQGEGLGRTAGTFNRDDFRGYGNDKLVLELHVYDNIFGPPGGNCSAITQAWFTAGFQALTNSGAAQFPLVVTEFGFPQDASADEDPYASCILDYFSSQHAGWMIWLLGGSYYIRQGAQDGDEAWGLLSHDWSTWRRPDFVNNLLSPAVKTSTAPISDSDDAGDSPDGGSPNDGPDDKPNSASVLGQGQAFMALTLGALGVVISRSHLW
ncbi:glycoside hydrolase superfamily [Nemania sp. NC0429]|nr:glycoside hydrolase superfamily [Nemania sp. NC0429]